MTLFSGIARAGIAAAALGAGLALTAPAGAQAQEVLGSYTAYIGVDDLYNSKGERLFEPWQILRQDRANFHRFGIRQPGDQDDPFFADADNRATMERFIMQGRIDLAARRGIVDGGVTVTVTIWGQGRIPAYLDVTVF